MPGRSSRPHATCLVVLLCAAVSGSVVGSATALDAPPPSFRVENAWVRQPPPSRDVAAAYALLINDGERPVRIISFESSRAEAVELHEMVMEGDVMRMRRVRELVVPPRSQIELEPGAMHLMLFGLGRPVEVATTVPFTLGLADGSALAFTAAVRGEERPR